MLLIFDLRPIISNEWASAVNQFQLEHHDTRTPFPLYMGLADTDMLYDQVHNDTVGMLMRTWWPKQPEAQRTLDDVVPAEEARPELSIMSWGPDRMTVPSNLVDKFDGDEMYALAWQAKVMGEKENRKNKT